MKLNNVAKKGSVSKIIAASLISLISMPGLGFSAPKKNQSGMSKQEIEAAEAEEDLSTDEIVDAFYEWYGYIPDKNDDKTAYNFLSNDLYSDYDDGNYEICYYDDNANYPIISSQNLAAHNLSASKPSAQSSSYSDDDDDDDTLSRRGSYISRKKPGKKTDSKKVSDDDKPVSSRGSYNSSSRKSKKKIVTDDDEVIAKKDDPKKKDDNKKKDDPKKDDTKKKDEPKKDDNKKKEVTASDEKREKFVNCAKSYLGTRYVFGGTSRSGIDCSGLVYLAAQDAGLGTLPRTARTMYNIASRIDKSIAKSGDLVFFTQGSSITHVAIYLGNDTILHAVSDGSKTGVITTKLFADNYWSKYFYAMGRIISD